MTSKNSLARQAHVDLLTELGFPQGVVEEAGLAVENGLFDTEPSPDLVRRTVDACVAAIMTDQAAVSQGASKPDGRERSQPADTRTPDTANTATVKAKTLEDAFYETLKDVYYAEKASVKTLKKSRKVARSPELRSALIAHAEESANQVERLTMIFELIGRPARSKTCEAMVGLTSEMEEDLEDFSNTDAFDDVLIGSLLAMEHYEIARYGRLRSWATKLGYDEAVFLFDMTLGEEEMTVALLTSIAGEAHSLSIDVPKRKVAA